MQAGEEVEIIKMRCKLRSFESRKGSQNQRNLTSGAQKKCYVYTRSAGFGPKRNCSSITGLNRSKCEVTPLSISRAKVEKDRIFPQRAQGKSSYLHIKHLQLIYIYHVLTV
jgi:hypothetical protein